MLQNLSIMLLSSAPKITYYAFEKMPIIPKIMQPILANDVSLQLYQTIKLISKPQIALNLFNCLWFQSILPFCDCYIRVIMVDDCYIGTIDCSIRVSRSFCTICSCKALSSPQNALILMHTYYGQNYAGIIASSLQAQLHHIAFFTCKASETGFKFQQQRQQ